MIKLSAVPPQYLYMKRGKILVLTTTKYRISINECRSHARRRPTLQSRSIGTLIDIRCSKIGILPRFVYKLFMIY
jgi:hypothetical protein